MATHTLTSIQMKFHDRCTLLVYYGPVKLPDFNYFIPRLKNQDDQEYLRQSVETYGFFKWDKFDEHINRIDKIFYDNLDLFMSDKGLEKTYLEFHILKNRLVKKKLTPEILKEVFLDNNKKAHFFYWTKSSAVKTKIDMTSKDVKKTDKQLFKTTSLKPIEAIELAIKGISRSRISSKSVTYLYIAYLILDERKKKTTKE